MCNRHNYGQQAGKLRIEEPSETRCLQAQACGGCKQEAVYNDIVPALCESIRILGGW